MFRLSSNPNAVGYASLASVKDTVKALKVDGVAPSNETILDGTYRVQRSFILVIDDDSKVQLTVRDTDIGIPKAHHDRIFERLYRVDKSHSKAIGGTGLGLSIVKHGAAFHNAEISLESEEDKGTTVNIIFKN